MPIRLSRRRPESDEPQLRPDDSGWLAELRRARADPVDLAPPDAAVDGPPAPTVEAPPAQGPAPTVEAPQAQKVAAPAEVAAPEPAQSALLVPAPTVWAVADADDGPTEDRPFALLSDPAVRPVPGRDPAVRPVPRQEPAVRLAPAPSSYANQRPASGAPATNVHFRWWVGPVAVGALLAGVGIGIGLSTREWNPAATTHAQPAVTASPAVTAQPANAEPAVPTQTVATGPASAPPAAATDLIVITGIQDYGTAVELSWIDPTGGQAAFVISELGDAGARAVLAVPAGQTDAIVGGLDPAAAQYCFRVLAVLSGQSFSSPTTCTPPRPGG